jgi:AcrR family transcriptional regulator
MTTTDSPTGIFPAATEEHTQSRVRLPRAAREQQMIDVATEVFGTLGYHPASMDQIALEASISKPMLYAYFDSKEGLYLACMRRSGDRLLKKVADSFVFGNGPEKNLWDGFLAFFEYLGDEPNAWRLVCGRSFHDMNSFRETAEQIHVALRGVVEDMCARSSRDTVGDPFADERRRAAVAHAMLGAAESLGAWWYENYSDEPPATPCRELMNFFWLGIDSLAGGREWTENAI